MENNEQLLKQIGLGDYEAQIYQVLLTASPANATSIAKKCQLSRSSVYTTLSSLIAKGLVGTTYKNEIKQFVAEDLSALENLIKKEKEVLDKKTSGLANLKKNLETLTNQSLNIPQIIFFEGQEGLKKIYLSMMRNAPKNSALYLLRDEFVWQPEWKFIFKIDWHDRVKRIKIEKNIKTKLLLNSSETEKKQIKNYKNKTGLEFRFLPESKKISGFAIYIIADMISILSMEKNNLIGIKITNKHLADNFKQVFEALWTQK